MSQIDCNACSDLKTYAPNFTENGIGDTECTSLAADTGLNPSLTPKHNDANDLHDMNDCLVGRPVSDLEKYEICDWQDFMQGYIPNVYETIKGIICAVGGIWTYIHNLLSRVGNLETRMTNVEGRVTTLEGKVDDLEDDVAGLKDDVSGLKTRMTAAEGTIAGHTTAISNLDNAVAGHASDINALNTTVSNQGAAITSINNRLDEIIAAMGGSSLVIPVTRHYRMVVEANRFVRMWKADDGSGYNASAGQWVPYSGGIIEWFSGANPSGGENWIKIPISEMDTIKGVWAQTWVVADGNPYDGVGKSFVQTVNVQQWYEQDGYLNVNFDAYIIAPEKTAAQNGAPYPITIDFLVVGEKAITT